MTKKNATATARAEETRGEEPAETSIVPAGQTFDVAPVIVAEDAALAEAKNRSLIEYLQRLENGEAILKRRMAMIETAQLAAIAKTRPQDWVLNRAADGSEAAMIKASGAQLVAPYYGLQLLNVRPLGPNREFAPMRIDFDSGAYGLRAWCDPISRLTGVSLEALEVTRRSDENFTGRQIGDDGKISRKHTGVAYDADLRNSVWTLLLTRSVRVCCGLTRVPRSELDRAWAGSNKTSAQCILGHGYGTSDERRSTEATDDPEIPLLRERLRNEILKRVGGGLDDARELLKEITSAKPTKKNPKGFAGRVSVDQMTEAWQFEKAFKALSAHPVYGDDAGEPDEK